MNKEHLFKKETAIKSFLAIFIAISIFSLSYIGQAQVSNYAWWRSNSDQSITIKNGDSAKFGVDISTSNPPATINIYLRDESGKLHTYLSDYNYGSASSSFYETFDLETSHYNGKGDYSVVIKSVDNDENEKTEVLDLKVEGTEDKKPDVSISASDTNPSVGDSIDLKVEASDDKELNEIEVKYGGSWKTYDCSGSSCSNEWTVTENSEGDYRYKARARDSSGQTDYDSVKVTYSEEDEPPVISDLRPSGTLSPRHSVTLKADTNEWARCEYKRGSDFPYSSGEKFDNTYGTYHSSDVSVSPGKSYKYYIKCEDAGDNIGGPEIIEFNIEERDDKPKVSITASDRNPEVGDKVTLTVDGSDDERVEKIGVKYDNDWHYHNCWSSSCSYDWSVTEHSEGTYNYKAKAVDDSGQRVYDSVMVAYNEEGPIISDLRPSGTLSPRHSVTLKADTNVWARCEYKRGSDFPYSTAERFKQTYGTFHKTDVSVTPGESYKYYVKCQNAAGEVGKAAVTNFNIEERDDKPKVSITASDRNPEVGDKVTLTVDGSDDERVEKIGVKYDNDWHYHNCWSSSCSYDWSVTEHSEGTYNYKAKAVDSDGQTDYDSVEVNYREKVEGEGSIRVITKDCEDSERLQDVNLILEGPDQREEKTDEDGTRKFKNLDYGDYTIILNKEGYNSKTVSVELSDGTDPVVKNVCLSKRDEEGKLIVLVENDDREPIDDAEIKLTGIDVDYDKNKDTEDEGKEVFDNLETGEYRLTVEKSGYEKEVRTINIDKGTQTEQIKLKREVKYGKLSVLVKNSDGDRIKDADVKAKRLENNYQRSRISEDDGRALFGAIRTGEYEISAKKDGYKTNYVKTEVFKDETTYSVVVLTPEDHGITSGCGLKIERITVPTNSNPGDRMKVKVKVENERNEGDFKVRASGFGHQTESSTFSLRSGETREFSLYHRVHSGYTGLQPLQINTIKDNCKEFTNLEIDVSESSLSMNLDPERILIGETAQVDGFIKGEDYGKLYMGGNYVRRVAPDQSGYYSSFVTPNEPGTYTVKMKAGDKQVKRTLKVDPRIQLKQVRVKDTVAVREQFQVCADIVSKRSTEADLNLYLDREQVENKNKQLYEGEQTVCFDTSVEDEGKHTAKVKLDYRDQEEGKSSEFRAIIPKEEIKIFSTKFDVEIGSSALLKVMLNNQDQTVKDYKIKVSGIDKGWLMIPEKSVTLRQGESKTLFIDINPDSLGQKEGKVKIFVNDKLVKKEDLRFYVAQERIKKQGIFGNLVALINANKMILMYLLAVILIIGTITGYWLVFKKSNNFVMEPNYK